MNFGLLISEARNRKQLSAYRLSKLSGVNRKTILDIENGIFPNLCTAEKLCKALGVTYVINGKR